MDLARGSVPQVEAADLTDPRWSPRSRVLFIIGAAAGLWTVPVAIVYGLARLL